MISSYLTPFLKSLIVDGGEIDLLIVHCPDYANVSNRY